MAQSITPESGFPTGVAHPSSGVAQGSIELDEPVVAGIAWELADGVLHVEFHGEICAWSVARLQPFLLGVLSGEHPGPIVVRLSGVTFFDASGVNLLIRARQLAADHGATLTLDAASHAVRRVLALCELDGEFSVR